MSGLESKGRVYLKSMTFHDYYLTRWDLEVSLSNFLNSTRGLKHFLKLSRYKATEPDGVV
jgi:hypothetical protein